MERCKRCNKELKDSNSCKIGYGPTCAKKAGVVQEHLKTPKKSKVVSLDLFNL